jgi:hypothetical protein
MREKTERLQRLLDAGYHFEEIESDSGSVVTTLRRGSSVVVLEFRPDEAGDLLYEPPRVRRRSA